MRKVLKNYNDIPFVYSLVVFILYLVAFYCYGTAFQIWNKVNLYYLAVFLDFFNKDFFSIVISIVIGSFLCFFANSFIFSSRVSIDLSENDFFDKFGLIRNIFIFNLFLIFTDMIRSKSILFSMITIIFIFFTVILIFMRNLQYKKLIEYIKTKYFILSSLLILSYLIYNLFHLLKNIFLEIDIEYTIPVSCLNVLILYFIILLTIKFLLIRFENYYSEFDNYKTYLFMVILLNVLIFLFFKKYKSFVSLGFSQIYSIFSFNIFSIYYVISLSILIFFVKKSIKDLPYKGLEISNNNFRQISNKIGAINRSAFNFFVLSILFIVIFMRKTPINVYELFLIYNNYLFIVYCSYVAGKAVGLIRSFFI